MKKFAVPLLIGSAAASLLVERCKAWTFVQPQMLLADKNRGRNLERSNGFLMREIRVCSDLL